uniref:Non-ribosomal peptide synthetase module-related protein n=2 Tax=Fischerella sp. MV11 TaxID=397321 RepID=E1U3N2_9CYAN|nr:non-ribosomal peptide synthetase module-related protein [Fischerella sp. MV11]
MATDILQKFKEQGIELWAEGDKLRFRATKGVLTPSLREELVNHKEAILRSLFWTGISSISDISQITPASQERYQPFPLTEIQQAYLLGRSEIFSLSGVSAHAYQEFEAANINIKQLNQSLNRVIAHHDMLRAIVLPSGEQKILEQVPEYEIKFLDLRGKSLQEVDSCLEKIRSEMSHQVLPTDKWPLFEIRATQINEEITLIHLSTDLLICDAYSNQLLIQEWFQVYHQPDIQLVGTEFSFRDYVLALASLQDSQLYQRSQAYWQKRLSTLPLAPDLPLVKQVSSITKPRFVRREGKLDSETWRKLKHKATQLHITGSGLLCAAFSEVLAVWNPNPHFTLNLTLFNRLPLHPEVEQILGDFTTTILLEVNQSLNTFTTRAQRLQQQIWEDLEYSQISGVQVLRELAKQQGRSSSGILMPVVFSSALFSEATQPQETATIPWKEVYGITQTPQVLLDHQVREDTGALIFNWDSVDEVFPPGMLDDMFAAYYQLLELLACDDSAWQQPTRQLVPQTQLEQQAVENATAAPISRELLHTLFATQVKAQRYSKAIVSHKRTMTYEELSDHAHQIGHQLRQLSVRPNQLVAVVMEKGWEQIVAVLGILNSGAAYLPIDPSLPTERQRYLLENGKVQVVLTQSWLSESLEWPENIQPICVDTQVIDNTVVPLEPIQQPEDLAYVIYTSGSTGLPKGVMIDHRGAVNTIIDINKRFGIGSEDKILALSALNFDLSVYDIFGTLAAGGTIVIPEPARTKDPAHWIELVDKAVVNVASQKLVAYVVPNLNNCPSLFAVKTGDAEKFITTWASLVQAGRQQALQLPLEMNLQLYGTFWQSLEDFCTLSMCCTLTKLGVFIQPREKHSLEELVRTCGIDEKQKWLLGHWLKVLQQEGLLEEVATETFMNFQPLPSDFWNDLWQEIERSATWGNQAQTWQEYVKCSIDNHPALLRGEIDLRELLFPDGSWKTAESLYALNPFTDYHNSIAQEILRVVVGDWNQDRPLQILEVGAGTGGTTAALLPVLLLCQAVYTYTDISQFFTNQAQDKFKNYSFIEYGILDVDKNPVHQGYEPHSFDVIVAANVIHNARNVDKTLEYLRSLLTPNGILLLLEVTKNSRTQMVTVGFIEQFTHLEDERKKTKMPLLSVAEWGKALDQAGFEEFVAFPESKSSTEALEQHLIVAKAPAHVRSFQPSVLHTYLHNKLPEYMLPSAYVLLETLPLSTNGKIDRKALPEFNLVKSQQEKTFVLPRTSLEKQLVEIWADILNIKQIGIHDNFFEIGGDSLLAIQVSSRVRQAFCVELPLRRLLDSPTIAGLAKYIQIARQEQQTENETVVENLPSVVPQLNMRFEPFSLTDIQQAYWVGRMGAFELGNVSTHIYLELLSRGLDLERLNLALQKLIERHDMLRAIILPDGQQQVLEKVPLYQIEILDLSRENEEAIAAGIDRVRQEMSHKVRPANQWPLFEFRVTLLNAGHVRLHVSIDAIILDGYSILTLFKEWSQLYEHPELALPPLEISFRNYIQAEQALRNTELYRRSQDYWFNRLDTLPKAPELPLAQKPHQQQLFKRRVSELDKTLWQQLNQRAAKAGITASGVLIAAFAEILTVWSKSPDFTINLTLFNRLPLHPQVNNLIGDFTSLNLLEVHNDTNESFSTRATRIQKQLWQDLEHRYVTGVEVLREMSRRQGGARVTMPVVFTSALVLGSLGEDASVLNHFGDLGYSVSQTPQVWLDHQVINKNGALVLIWDAVEELFPEGLLDEMYESYCNFLKRLATSDQEWIKPIRQLVPTTNLELQAAVNATAAPVAEELLHTMFLRQVQVRTHSPAVITSQQSFTYQELFTRANSVGHRLRKLGVSPNQLVAVVMEKGWEQIVAVLGILMSGAAYLPIDPELPTERRLYLLTQGEAVCILTQSHLNQDLEWPNSIPRLCLDDSDDLLAVDKSPLHSVQSPEDLAYVIYTSGSTGLPKGVMIDHRGAVNTITDINQRFGIGSDDKILALSSLNFDLSVYDIFGTLAAGGTIVIPDASARKYPAHWLELMQREQVTVWNSIPTLMQMLVEYAGGCQETLPISLRLVMLSGDWIPLNLPNLIKAAANQTQIVSLGGATEASIWSICYPIETVDRHWKSIPYGKPLQNQRLYVLKESLEPCPVWAVGQLYIGGIGLAQGYWHDEQKTNSSFIIHPHTGERLYQTGDLGRYLPDGNIEFLGRVDSQVKIRGHRIELGEVESTLAQHPAIRSVAVVAVGDDEKSKDYLVAYVVPDREQTVTEEQLIVNLRTFLKQKLPEYMIPSAFLTLETLPLNPNGKVDRKALVKQTYFQPEPEVVYVAPQNEVERIIAKVFQELMQVENVGLYDNFFHLGANSLHLVRLHSKLQEIFHQDFAIATLFQSPTIYALAQHFNAYHAE